MPRKPGWRRVWILVAASVEALPELIQPLPVAASSTGTLFGVTGLDRSTVSSIDLGTGAVTPIAQLGLPPDFNAQVTNLTGDAATHRIFALRLSVIVPPPPANFTMIFEILTIDGQSHAVIADTPVNAPIGDIQFDPLANTMYALVPSGFQGANGVVRVDLSTGAISPVASIGPPGPFSDSMVLAPHSPHPHDRDRLPQQHRRVDQSRSVPGAQEHQLRHLIQQAVWRHRLLPTGSGRDQPLHLGSNVCEQRQQHDQSGLPGPPGRRPPFSHRISSIRLLRHLPQRNPHLLGRHSIRGDDLKPSNRHWRRLALLPNRRNADRHLTTEHRNIYFPGA